MKLTKYLNDEELIELSYRSILVEGLQGLIKIERNVILQDSVKIRIGTIISGNSVISERSDIGLAGGAIIQESNIGQNSAITNGAKIFHSICGDNLRNYGSTIKASQVGDYFVIRNMAEVKNVIAAEKNKFKMFSQAYDCHLGSQNSVGAHSILKQVSFGDQNKLGDYSKIEYANLGDENQVGSYVHVMGTQDQQVIIEDNCTIGNHVIIKSGCRINSYTTIPDHSIVMSREGKTVMSVIDFDTTLNGEPK